MPPEADRSFFRWLFEDRTSGRIVIAQAPNLLLWVFLVALAAGFFVPAGLPSTIARVVYVSALALWGLDELARGVNPWRRFIGITSLLGIAVYVLLRSYPGGQ